MQRIVHEGGREIALGGEAQPIGVAHRDPFGAFEEFGIAANGHALSARGEIADGGEATRLGAGAGHGQSIGILEPQPAQHVRSGGARFPFFDLGQHGVAIGRVAPLHLVGPDRAGVIDQHVDRAVGDCLVCDCRTEPVAIIDRIAGCFELLPDQSREDILFGEALGPDHDAIVRAVAELNRKRGDDPQQHCDQSREAEPSAAGRQPLFDRAEQRVRDQGKPGACDAPCQHQHPVLRLQSREDRIAEAWLADGGRKRRGADGPHRGGADARHDIGRGQGGLDQPQSLPEAHAHTIRRFENAGIEIGLCGHRIAQDRQQRVERKREQGGQETKRRQSFAEHSAQAQQDREEQRQQRQRGDGLDETCETQRGTRDGGRATGPDRQRQRHRDTECDCRCRKQDMRGEFVSEAEQGSADFAHCARSASLSACARGTATRSCAIVPPTP